MDRTSPVTADVSPLARPQSMMFSFLGIYALEADVAISTRSVIDVFARLGVSEEAVRSTLTRMVRRGLLARQRDGRQVFVGLTPRAVTVLEDGQARVWKTGAVNREWDGTWTIVAFSLPDARRRDRHELRSRLIWEGFGPLHSGQWIASGARDVAGIIDDLGLSDHVHVLTARSMSPTTDGDLVASGFDTAAIAQRYHSFVQRWDVPQPLPEVPDDLARQLLLHTDWLQMVRQDPHLPAQHLPPDWPAIRADHVFRELADRYQTSAASVAHRVMVTAPRRAPSDASSDRSAGVVARRDEY